MHCTSTVSLQAIQPDKLPEAITMSTTVEPTEEFSRMLGISIAMRGGYVPPLNPPKLPPDGYCLMVQNE
jgi:hypothetical protein